MNSYNAYGKMGTSSDIILNLPFVKNTYHTHPYRIYCTCHWCCSEIVKLWCRSGPFARSRHRIRFLLCRAAQNRGNFFLLALELQVATNWILIQFEVRNRNIQYGTRYRMLVLCFSFPCGFLFRKRHPELKIATPGLMRGHISIPGLAHTGRLEDDSEWKVR